MLHIQGQAVGLACRDGFYLGARCVDARNSSGWDASQNLLMNRALEVAVFEHSPRAILTDGLPYDKCHVGVVTDVSGFEPLADHYSDSLDKLYNVVRTQVDVVLPFGTAVLNTADPQVVELAALCDGQVIFYGISPELETLAVHRSSGKCVVFVQDAHIVLAKGQETVGRMSLESIRQDMARPAEWVLAAVGAAWALGVSPELIGAGLRTFDQTLQKNS